LATSIASHAAAGTISAHDHWDSSRPGLTLFLPVCDVSAEGLACTKALCNYIYDTYGRFPCAIDALHLMWVRQVHHIDTDYYNRFFGGDAYGPTHAAHMTNWHLEARARANTPGKSP
jgi:hypothetical protein